jgi:hypothetical protein
MPSLVIKCFIASVLLFVLSQDQQKPVERLSGLQKRMTTVRVPAMPISGPKDRYHSLTGSMYYSYLDMFPSPPEHVNFELVSVVKARKLNTDLYVVFLVDGKPVHFGSNRSAIRKPVPGKPWIGERMVFHIPPDNFYKMAAAEKLGVKLGGVSFDFPEEFRQSIRETAKKIRLTLTN